MESIPMYTPVRDYMNHQKSYDHCWKTVVQKGDFIMGDQIFQLEHKLAQYAHSTHCITMGSGTDALLAALLALNVGPGDKVITVPFTWISTAEVVSLLGATPVFIDIEDESYEWENYDTRTSGIKNLKQCVNLRHRDDLYISAKKEIYTLNNEGKAVLLLSYKQIQEYICLEN